ncbi:MAG: glycosyltransferase [Calditrichaeota bacterium]|nr:glycosyltransferase [Calditrichota bacterium]MBT7789149.1 glycosyltransferase [Calditrichota bacterium]
MNDQVGIDVSVIIVNYNVKHFADQCLKSVFASQGSLSIEVLLIDNASEDGSIEFLQDRFPDVKFIANNKNVGFGRANNIALEKARGRFLLVLNPDTLLSQDSLTEMVKYIESNPEVGAIGPKILTRYGSFDKTSKRGLPTPWVSFCRISGLSKLFPKSKTFGKYDLLYLDPDKPAEVETLVGCCMLVRAEAYNTVGGFDEDFFMYGEDIDWSYRISLAGWKVHYAPVTRIVHFRGESTRRSSINADKAFYSAMHLFADKHFRNQHNWLSHQLINLGIILAHTASKIGKVYRKVLWPSIDWIGYLGILASARWVRSWDICVNLGMSRWGNFDLTTMIAAALSVQSLVWIASFAGFGVYGKQRGNSKALFWGLLVGFLINSSLTYFFKQFAYSRFVTLYGLIFGGLFVWGWRYTLHTIAKTKYWQFFLRRRTLIVGAGCTGRTVLKKIRSDQNVPYLPVGFIDPDGELIGSLIDDLPVIGGEDDLLRLLKQEKIEEILFAHENLNYDHLLNIVSKIGLLNGVNFKVITPDMVNRSDNTLPLLSVEYLAPRGVGRALRRFSDYIVNK